MLKACSKADVGKISKLVLNCQHFFSRSSDEWKQLLLDTGIL